MVANNSNNITPSPTIKHLLDHLGVDYEVFGHKGVFLKHFGVTPGLLAERGRWKG